MAGPIISIQGDIIGALCGLLAALVSLWTRATVAELENRLRERTDTKIEAHRKECPARAAFFKRALETPPNV